MDSDLQFQQRITAELAASDPPPLGSIVADATARGDRLRRRRWFAGAAGVALLTAGVVLVSVAAVGPAHVLGRQPAGAEPADASPTPVKQSAAPTAVDQSAAPTPTSSPTVAPSPAYTTGRAVVALLF